MPPKKLKTTVKSRKIKSKSSLNVVSLNIDCLLMIFSYLSISERIKVERVCKLWHKASQSGWVGFQSLNFKKSLWGFSPKTKVTITDKILRSVLLRCGSYLRKVTFSHCSNEPDCLRLSLSQRCLGNMWEMCPNLKILDFGMHRIRSSDLSILANNLPNLEVLRLELNSNISDEDLSTIFASKKKLKTVHLYHNDSANVCTCVKYLPKNSIEEIMICNCYGASTFKKIYDLFSSFLEVCPKLKKFRSLSIHNITHNMSAWAHHSCTECFQSMVLQSCTIFCDTPMSNLLALENLQELTFYGNRGDTNEFLIAVSTTCTKLVKLNLQACGSVTDRGLSAIALKLNLKELTIVNMGNICGKDLPKMHTLQYFKSENCKNLREKYLAQMVLTAAADSRTFYLTHSYFDLANNRNFSALNGKLLQAVAKAQLYFQALIGEGKVIILII